MVNNLETILKKNQIKKADFAKSLGVTPNTIQNWCKATSMHSETMHKIADKLNVNVCDVFEM